MHKILPYTVAAGTKSAGGIAHKVKKKFHVEVMFIISSKVICKIVDGFKKKDGKVTVLPDLFAEEDKMEE